MLCIKAISKLALMTKQAHKPVAEECKKMSCQKRTYIWDLFWRYVCGTPVGEAQRTIGSSPPLYMKIEKIFIIKNNDYYSLFTRVCLQCRRPWFDSWVWKIPWRRKWQPSPVFLPGEFQGQRNLVGYRPWCFKESDITGQLTHTNTCMYICTNTYINYK